MQEQYKNGGLARVTRRYL